VFFNVFVHLLVYVHFQVHIVNCIPDALILYISTDHAFCSAAL